MVDTSSYSRLYNIWRCMKQRCNNQNNTSYYRYGGRGIKVCDEWQKYAPFKEWALSHGYNDTLEIDRKDNDGNYDPDNCHWITKAKNLKKRNKPYTHPESHTHKLKKMYQELVDEGVDMTGVRVPKYEWEN